MKPTNKIYDTITLLTIGMVGFIIIGIVLAISLAHATRTIRKAEAQKYDLRDAYIAEQSAARDAEWEEMIEALIEVESSGRDGVEGDGGQALGCSQIHPCIVEDCDRILGRQIFTLSDRTDRAKSVEMFNVIQEHYNPERNIHLALKIWNSGAPVSYHRKVVETMERGNDYE